MLLSSGSMGLLRRPRDLGLEPLAGLHEEFLSRPNAEQLLAEAEEDLARREEEHSVSNER